jgi:hypothetical protein
MPSAVQNHTTNPTGIQEIPRSSILADFHRNKAGVIESISLEKLDFGGLKLPSDAQIRVIAKARYTEEILDGGSVTLRKPIKNVSLTKLDLSSPLHLRVIVFDPADKRILASCERLNAIETDDMGSLALLPVDPVELGNQLWQVQPPDTERGPILQVNSDERFTMLEDIKSDPQVQALVLPAAIGRVLEHLLRNPPDDDDPLKWQNRWLRFLEERGITVPQIEEGEALPEVWLTDSVDSIAAHLKLLEKAAAKGQEGAA